MYSKTNKSESKVGQKFKSIRVNLHNQKKLEKILLAANKKKKGRKVKLDHLLEIALDLIEDHHIKMLQDRSMTNEDRQEELRQKYIATRGPISRDEFIGFTMSPDYFEFLKMNSLQVVQAAAG